MNKGFSSIWIGVCLTLSFFTVCAQGDTTADLANRILKDSRIDTIQQRALRLLSGFTAGSSYGEVWIRDLNTFINGSLQVHNKDSVKQVLLMFFKVQAPDGNIPDGVIKSTNAAGGYKYQYSPLLPEWAAHKNTVETDQESSLVQAVKKYVDATGDTSILAEKIGKLTVLKRMEMALYYVHHNRWNDKYGLVIGATTIDWGDVQPENGWGVAISEKTKWAVDIYDNAMYVTAIQDWLTLKPPGYTANEDWQVIARNIKLNVRKFLWDPRAMKYIPHLYLAGSPFADTFKERSIFYTGGTICAMIAGFHTNEEIKAINSQLIGIAKEEKFATVGITVYPPYPASQFPNMPPFTYQNSGDWTWFGARLIPVLVANGQAEDAYQELLPMIKRTLAAGGFFEWYDVRTGAPKGSGDFRGEAGVLLDAIKSLRQWALRQQSIPSKT